jgi:hypothetical protein
MLDLRGVWPRSTGGRHRGDRPGQSEAPLGSLEEDATGVVQSLAA